MAGEVFFFSTFLTKSRKYPWSKRRFSPVRSDFLFLKSAQSSIGSCPSLGKCRHFFIGCLLQCFHFVQKQKDAERAASAGAALKIRLRQTPVGKKRGRRVQWVMFLAENLKNTAKREHRI
ncbi:MAG: hypothetical protein E7663_05965 [Ruminococcaceae bacterium]|nr:hypothetical protein [Oscillospiraceae bacterium]